MATESLAKLFFRVNQKLSKRECNEKMQVGQLVTTQTREFLFFPFLTEDTLKKWPILFDKQTTYDDFSEELTITN